MSDETFSFVARERALTALSGARRRTGFLAAAFDKISFQQIFDIERDRLYLWAPVAFGAGIAVYFGLPQEPSFVALATLSAILAIVAAFRFGDGRRSSTLFFGLLLAALGATDASFRTWFAAAPVIDETGYPLEVTGRVTHVELREGGSVRLHVSPTSIEDRPEIALPRALSVWMRGKWKVPEPGQLVRFDAILRPPPDPAIPGGFDYARQAWFEGIGGVGFITSPPVGIAANSVSSPIDRASAFVERLRLSISVRVTAAVPGPAGAIAAALITGKRGEIAEADQEALRASGLAHILAISGLHMMLVVGTLFWIVRAGLALSPDLALKRPIKKWAALVALAGGTGYLILSGGSIATQRAFIMAAIMIAAVLIDRPAITLRNVATAALVVLALTPEALVTASFQMSFAATIALVAAYEALRTARTRERAIVFSPILRYLIAGFVGLAFTALIAGLATGPFAVFHFNRVALYGLIANIAAMPLVSLIVMPMGLFGVCLMPFALDGMPLAVMGYGIDGVLHVAHTVAGWDGAVRMVPQVSIGELLAVVLGGLWLALWRTPIRLLGIPVIVVAVGLGTASRSPDVLVSRDAGMAALRLADGNLVFLPRAGSDYEVEQWQRSAGIDPATKPARPACDGAACVVDNGDIRLSYVVHVSAFEEDCRWAEVVVTQLEPPAWCGRLATVIGPRQAEAGGATELRREEGKLRVRTTATVSGERPWTRRSGRPSLAAD